MATETSNPSTPPSTGSVLYDVFQAYRANIPPHLQAIDVFLAYVLITGIVQFIYCMLVGTFPFNSFLAGFLSCVGMFVLTVSLRMQLNEANRSDPCNRWQKVTPTRAVSDWLFCNLILHLAVLNFLG